jgi:hypothetical protein
MLNGLLKRRAKGIVHAEVDGARRLRGFVYCAALDVRRAAVGVTDARALELLGMALENLRELAGTVGEPAESVEIGDWARDLHEAASAVRAVGEAA